MSALIDSATRLSGLRQPTARRGTLRQPTARRGTLRRALALGGALALAGGVAGCDRGGPDEPPLSPVWRVVTRPTPDATIADLAYCAGRWYLAGTAGAGPAAWTSTDLSTWAPVVLHATTPYGSQGSFTSLACRDRDVVAVGSATGGIHGNPRVSTWRSRPGGDWTEISAPFDLYGGQRAGSVDRVVSGPDGWLIIGHRVSPSTGQRGAAVWYSMDGSAFQLVDDDPALRSTTSSYTTAYDAAAGPAGWVLVGSAGSAISPGPAVWASADGLHWRRTPVEPGPTGPIERVVAYPRGGLLAVGGGHAELLAAGDHETFEEAGTTCPGEVAALAAADSVAVAVTGGELCASQDGMTWRRVNPPILGSPDVQPRLAVGGGVLALAAGSSLWTTTVTSVTG